MKITIYKGDYFKAEEVEAEPITLKVKGFDGYEFALHTRDANNEFYTVSCVQSGASLVSNNFATREEAISEAEINLNRAGEYSTSELIKKVVDLRNRMIAISNHPLFDFCIGFQKIYGVVTEATIENVQKKLKRLGYKIVPIEKDKND